MNYQSARRRFASKMTSKCQVTIPKEIRDELGLKGGDRVRFELTADGDALIVPVDKAESEADRREDVLQGVREARAIYKAKGVDLGMSNDEFFDLMRGPPAEK